MVDDLPVYTVDAADITVTNQTDCVGNGSAQVTDILIDGLTNGGVAGFTFAWFDDAGAPIAGSGAGATVGVPLGAGNYRVLATNIASQCSSLVSVFTVDDLSVTPLIASSAIVDNSNCGGAASNGSITITVDGAVPGAGHTIQWYTGIGLQQSDRAGNRSDYFESGCGRLHGRSNGCSFTGQHVFERCHVHGGG